MSVDPRCCGTGTCIINNEGVCWCGQLWDGEKMGRPKIIKSNEPEKDKKTVGIVTDRSDSSCVKTNE